MSDNNLKKRTISGVQWNTLERLSTIVITFVVTIVLARILGPHNYGIIGIASIFIYVFQNIVDSGFSAALIRKENVTEEDYSTAFFFNLFASLLLFVSLFFSAPYISHFFKQPVLTQLLRIMGVIVIINAICITQVTKLTRSLNFKRQAIVSFIANIISAVVGIIMAISDYGVWSLAFQQISLYGVKCLLLCITSKWLPSFNFSNDSFSYLFKFGWKILLSNIISNIWVQGNKIIVGRMYSADILGFYTKANDLPNQIANSYGSIIKNVSYPALSSIQNHDSQLQQSFRKILRMNLYLSSIICLGLSATAPSLVSILYGDAWIPAASFMQILCLGYLFHSPILFVLSLLQIKNRTDLFLILEIIAKIVAIIPFTLGILYGIHWLVWGSVFLSVFQFAMDLLFASKQIDYHFSQILKDIIPGFAVSSSMYLLLMLVSLFDLDPLVLFVIQFFIGFLYVIIISKLFDLMEFQECLNITTSIFKKEK